MLDKDLEKKRRIFTKLFKILIKLKKATLPQVASRKLDKNKLDINLATVKSMISK